MPGHKRLLAEVDPNVNASSASRKSLKTSTASTAHGETKQKLEGKSATQEEQIDYRSKDNAKLRRFLSERRLSTGGSREELIARLESSSIGYETFTSERLSQMLKERQLVMASQGTKEYKIRRIRINDRLDHDSGSSDDTRLYHTLSFKEEMLQGKYKRQHLDYSRMNRARLSMILEQRRLSTSGSVEIMIKRLLEHDQGTDQKQTEQAKEDCDRLRQELEARTGRSVRGVDMQMQDARERAADRYLQQEFQASQQRPMPVCDYNWKDSHWADRTERQLIEICRRREMPGFGPKAAMLKWLDTGRVDYEDLYTTGLERICHERGVPFRSQDKKADLVRRLLEADKASEE